MGKRMTAKMLKTFTDLSNKDKDLIETHVKEHGGVYPEEIDSPLRCAIRAYLVRSTVELVIDKKLRKAFGQMSACFADGWGYAMREAAPKIGG